MNHRFFTNPFVTDQEHPEPISQNGPDSPSSGDDSKITSAPSPKKGRRGVQKRVVSVPIGEVEGSKSKGDAYPPSDSWAWRKYGQKPIKGSPYPRGYYRCSSSKGCPARKQVERSRVDPTMLIITYACDHNHPLPTTKHHHHHHRHSSTTTSTTTSTSTGSATTSITSAPANFPPEELAVFANQPDLELGDRSLLASEFGWFADDVASTNVLDSPICCAGSSCTDADIEMMFSMREDEESLFADLGELPECSVVFRRSVVEPEGENRRCGLSTVVPCCGSTG